MSRFDFTDTIIETITKMSGGNPGAVGALYELLKINKDVFIIDLCTLDLLEIYEDRIYMLWNDCCNRNTLKMAKVLRFFREGKIAEKDINERLKDVGYGKSFDDLLNEEE